MASKKSLGGVFVISAIALSLFGIVVMLSTSIPLSQKNFGESYYYVRHQLLFGAGIGLLLLLFFRFLGCRRLRPLSILIFIFSIALLILVLIPSLSFSVGGTRSWIEVGGFSFQPSEIAKLGLIVYLAAWLDKNRGKVQSRGAVVPFLLIMGSTVGLTLLQRDLGTAVIIAAIAIAMYFSAGAKLRAIIPVILIGFILAGIFIITDTERVARIKSYINPSEDPQGESYQLNQAKIAVGSGGLYGKGLGKSVQKYQYLPESVGDAVFAIVGEELGFLGASALVLGYVFLIITGLRIARASQTNYGTFLVVGITTWFGFQALVNIGGIIGLIPFTGVPLPFISYGGTALAMELAAVGIVSSVAKG